MPKTTARTTVKKLSNLEMEEISGVDHPAHLAEGWLVMKSTSGSNELPDEIREILNDITKAEGDNMPEDNKKGGKEPRTLDEAQKRIQELEGKVSEYQKPDPNISTTSSGTDESKGRTGSKGGDEADKETQRAQQQAEDQELADAKEKIQQLEAALEAAQSGANEDEVQKALILKSLPPHVRQFVEGIDAKANQALQELQKARDDAADRVYIEKAKSWSALPTNPSTIGPALRKLADTNPSLSGEIERVLSAANEASSKAGITKELGGWGAIDDETPMARLNSLANELVQKSTTPLTVAEAMDQVIATPAGKKIYEEYQNDKKRSIAAGGN